MARHMALTGAFVLRTTSVPTYKEKQGVNKEINLP